MTTINALLLYRTGASHFSRKLAGFSSHLWSWVFRRLLPCIGSATLGMLSLRAASLNVTKFGATGNGTTDDTKAIQTAVSSSAPGDTILFAGGTYRLSAPINLLSGRRYQGQNGTRVMGVPGSYTFMTPYNATSNITITGLTIDGAGINLQGDTVPAANVQITNCTLESITNTSGNWTVHWAIFAYSGLSNSSIANNKFYNILWGGQIPLYETPVRVGGIWGRNLRNTKISDNTCNTVGQCMYLQSDQSASYSGILISNNTGTLIHDMGIEMQLYNTSNVRITNNTFTSFLNPYWNTFGISFASGISNVGALIQNNTLIIQPAPPKGSWYGYGIEAWGTNTFVANNAIKGYWGEGIGIGASSNLVVENNYLCGSASTQKIGYQPLPHTGAMLKGNVTSPSCN